MRERGSRERYTSMNRSILSSVVAAALLTIAPSCSAPDVSTHTARGVPDEPPAPTPATTEATSGAEKQPIPVADRMRALDKTIYKVNVDDLPAFGPPTAPLTVVLFSDYECPYCRKLEPQLAQLRADHGSDVRIVLAPKPLPFHKQAKPAALAAIAAAEQGKLEAMHRALVALDGKLDDASLTNAAREAGLDLGRFDADRRGAKAEEILTKADEIAKRFSVKGTPTTFINGRRITGSVPDVIHALGEEQLAVGRRLIKEGAVSSKIYETIVAKGLESAPADPSISNTRVFVTGQGQQKPASGYLEELSKCWSAPGGASASTIDLTIGPDGKVLRVATEPPELAACVTKIASPWTFQKTEGESRVKFVIQKP
jgi:protein-disulfide isomerase